MNEFKARLDELDTVHGLTHQVVVAEAVDASTGRDQQDGRCVRVANRPWL